jgi:acyl carrier protein
MDMKADTKVRSQMRNYVTQRLQMKGDGAAVGDEDLLFSSGRLDSLDAIEIIMCIETEYRINFAEINFDLTRLDSITAIADLVNRYPR